MSSFVCTRTWSLNSRFASKAALLYPRLLLHPLLRLKRKSRRPKKGDGGPKAQLIKLPNRKRAKGNRAQLKGSVLLGPKDLPKVTRRPRRRSPSNSLVERALPCVPLTCPKAGDFNTLSLTLS